MGTGTRLASGLVCLLLSLSACGITERNGSASRGNAFGGSGSAKGGDRASTAASGGAANDTTTLVIEVHGLPPAVTPVFSVSGMHVDLQEPGRYADMLPGQYMVRTVPLFDGGPIVRTLLLASVGDRSTFELHEGETYTLELDYGPVPTSGKLWRAASDHASVVGFPNAIFLPKFGPVPREVVAAPAGRSLAFDREGNLWTLGPTTGHAHLLRYAAKALDGSSPNAEPDVTIDLAEVSCTPAINDLAFDSAGGLWLTVCGDQLCKLEAETLVTSGRTNCDQILPGPLGGGGLAFSQHGDLFIAASAKIERIPRQTVANPANDEPHTALTVAGPGGVPIDPHAIAFDRDGNLWGIDASFDSVFEVSVDDLGNDGDVSAQAFALLETTPAGLAFDDLGMLWVGHRSGEAWGLTVEDRLHLPEPPAHATASITVQLDPTTGPLGFFPAASGLPLYHSFTAEAAP